ncbi:hypothetical protein CYMTET_32690 [Cymbomonas tetramitiformis]|uniref:Phosphonopyruvate decarboxylase n=1 Tax=Cymbomonas tetramitiformis TaxID=36881 RepID=A0AAE0KRZ3_9CHLO|nr:hypothetical protein CYMTET_32690 [Cymbomonas tetramitiformis]|eukprot:gene28482-35316_t
METCDFCNLSQRFGISFVTGVPDSLLKPLTETFDALGNVRHVIAANEGNAVALAFGYHVATGKIPLVYCQNSGLGNMVNPLTSLVSRETHLAPMVLVIGWRGEPTTKDEPQHKGMGALTLPLLQYLDIPTLRLSSREDANHLPHHLKLCASSNRPVALVISKGFFLEAPSKPSSTLISRSPERSLCRVNHVQELALDRMQALNILLKQLSGNEVVVCTTGFTSRDFLSVNEAMEEKFTKVFLNVGAMGHASSVAAGLAANGESVVCLDGDGAMLMHLGALAVIAEDADIDLLHVVFNNGMHESVGKHPTAAQSLSLCGIADSCGYPQSAFAVTPDELVSQFHALGGKGMRFLEVAITKSVLTQTSKRPSTTPQQRLDLLKMRLRTKL